MNAYSAVKIAKLAALHGELGTILEWAAQNKKTPGADATGLSVSVAAGARYLLDLLISARGIPHQAKSRGFSIFAPDTGGRTSNS